jgi:hypothetical protein
MLKILKVIGIVAIASIATLILLPWLYVAADLVRDRTNWRVEDYMCTLPEGCKEFIAERKHHREQLLTPKGDSPGRDGVLH